MLTETEMKKDELNALFIKIYVKMLLSFRNVLSKTTMRIQSENTSLMFSIRTMKRIVMRTLSICYLSKKTTTLYDIKTYLYLITFLNYDD